MSRIHTFDSLKEPSYRWLWLGMLGSFAGMQMQMLARGWLVVDKLDGSALDLGIVTSSNGLPLLVLSLFGGVISDRFPKRNLLIITQSCNGLIALLVALLIVTDRVQIWHHDRRCHPHRYRLRLQHARPSEPHPRAGKQGKAL